MCLGMCWGLRPRVCFGSSCGLSPDNKGLTETVQGRKGL